MQQAEWNTSLSQYSNGRPDGIQIIHSCAQDDRLPIICDVLTKRILIAFTGANLVSLYAHPFESHGCGTRKWRRQIKHALVLDVRLEFTVLGLVKRTSSHDVPNRVLTVARHHLIG